MFLTSKPVREIQHAFNLVVKAQTVKQGEQLLNDLRTNQQFPLLIANYISSSTTLDKHCKILAILEIKKIVHTLDDKPENQSIWWHLYEQYYKSQDTISNLILNVILKNSHSYPIFLNVDCKNFSLAQNFRVLKLISDIFQENQFESKDFWQVQLMHIEYALVNQLQFGNRQLMSLTAMIVNSFLNFVQKYQFQISDVWNEVLKMNLKESQNTSEFILKFLQYRVCSLQSKNVNKEQFKCTYQQFCQCLKLVLEQNTFQNQGIKTLTQIYQYLPTSPKIAQILEILHRFASDKIAMDTDQQLISYIQTELSKDQYPLLFLKPLALKIIQKLWNNFEKQYKSQSQLNKLTELYIVFLVSFCPRVQISQLHCFQSILSGLINYLLNQKLQNYTNKKKQIKFQIFIILKSLENCLSQITPQTMFYIFSSISSMARKCMDLAQLCYHFLNEKIGMILKNMSSNQQKTKQFFKQHVYNINRNQWAITVSTFEAPLLIIMNIRDISEILDEECFKMFEILLDLLNQPNQMNHQIAFLLIDVIQKVCNYLQITNKQQKIITSFINSLYKLINMYQLWSKSASQIYLIKLIRQQSVLEVLREQLVDQYFWVPIPEQKLQFNLTFVKKVLDYCKRELSQAELDQMIIKISENINRRKDIDNIMRENYELSQLIKSLRQSNTVIPQKKIKMEIQ